MDGEQPELTVVPPKFNQPLFTHFQELSEYMNDIHAIVFFSHFGYLIEETDPYYG